MEQAISHYFNKMILEKIKLNHGWKETYLLTLSDHQKVIFRAHKNYADTFERERFFYDTVNSQLGKMCPQVYVVDGSCTYYGKSFQISEYLEGVPLSQLLESTESEAVKKELYYELGKTIAKIHQVTLDASHPYVASRTSWERHFAESLLSRQLNRIIKNGFLTVEEAEALCCRMKEQKAAHSLSFIHRDFRPDNIIYKDGAMYVIDAETCEFGDPLDDWARISLEWTYWEMLDEVLAGYRSVTELEHNNPLFLFYQLEILAEILDMHYNYGCMNDTTPHFLRLFQDAKKELLHAAD